MSIHDLLQVDFQSLRTRYQIEFSQLPAEEKSREDMERQIASWVTQYGIFTRPLSQATTFLRYLYAISRAIRLEMSSLTLQTNPSMEIIYAFFKPKDRTSAITQDKLIQALAMILDKNNTGMHTLQSLDNYTYGAMMGSSFATVLSTIDETLPLLSDDTRRRMFLCFDYVAMPDVVTPRFMQMTSDLRDALEPANGDDVLCQEISAQFVDDLASQFRSLLLYYDRD